MHTSQEMGILKLPTVRFYFGEAIGVDLTNKATEIVVLEVYGQDFRAELLGSMYNKGIMAAPAYDVVSACVSHYGVQLNNKWRQLLFMQSTN